MKIKPLKWVCILGLMAGLVSCGVDMPKVVNTSFETIVVERQDITVPVKFSAKLKGEADVVISPQVSGQLMQICVTEGQQVKKGTVLFVIDSRNAQLDLEAAQANLQAAEASARSAKLEYESNKNLFEKNIVSRYMLDNSENSYHQAQAAVSQAQAAVSRAKVNLGFCTITSPVTSIIGEIPVSEGIQVSPSTQLTIVSGNTKMEAIFSVPEIVLEEAFAQGYEGKIEDALKLFPDVTFVMKASEDKTERKNLNYYVKKAYTVSYNAILNKYKSGVGKFIKRPWISAVLLGVAAVLLVIFMRGLPSAVTV